MKSLTESINEAHVSTSAPSDLKEMKAERAAYEKDLKASKKHQEELEADWDTIKDQLKYPGYKDMLERNNVAMRYRLAREKAEQAYCELMIEAIDEIIKDIK